MAEENTAINELIHLVAAPRVAGRDSQDDMFWARNQASGRGGRALPGVRPIFDEPEEDALTAIRSEAPALAPGPTLRGVEPPARRIARGTAPHRQSEPPAVIPRVAVTRPMGSGALTPSQMTPAQIAAAMTPAVPAVIGTPVPGRLPTRPSMRPTLPFLEASDATVRVDPLPLDALRDEPVSFVRELAAAAKRFAAPLGALVVIAVFAGGYFAFDGEGGKQRTPATPQVTVTPIEPAQRSLSSVITTRIADVQAEQVLADQAPAPVAVETPEPVEIEMAPIAATTAHRRHHRTARVAKQKVAIRRSEKPKQAVKLEPAEKADKRVAEATLPDNVANKTASSSGKLAVTSNVPAMVYVDGRATKMMTPVKFAVPEGPHKITLLEPASKKAKTQDIEIVAGKTTSIDKQF